ncbi:DUF3560 domain-containing protein (plasmid) [Streptomyces sp. NBC_00708]
MTSTATEIPNCRHHGPMTATSADETAEHGAAGTDYHCPDPVCRNAVLRPPAGTGPEATIEITHTRADGTLLEGSSKGDGVFEIVRRHRFWFGRSLPGVLFIRQSRDKAADWWSINGAAQALRAEGWTVIIDVDEDARRTFGEAEADRVERAEARAERFEEYAGNAASRSEAAWRGARQIADGIPLGQPILVGHHSEARARRDQERIDAGYRKSITEDAKAKRYAGRAASAGAYEAFRTNPARTLRRIKSLEADARRVEKWLAGKSAGGYTESLTPARVAELKRRQEELADELGYWRHVIEQAEGEGFRVWGPADFKKGDFAQMRGRWYEVLRVNKVTLSVPGGPDIQPVISLETHAYPGMRGTRPYDEVTGRMSAEQMAELQAGAGKLREERGSTPV